MNTKRKAAWDVYDAAREAHVQALRDLESYHPDAEHEARIQAEQEALAAFRKAHLELEAVRRQPEPPEPSDDGLPSMQEM